MERITKIGFLRFAQTSRTNDEIDYQAACFLVAGAAGRRACGARGAERARGCAGCAQRAAGLERQRAAGGARQRSQRTAGAPTKRLANVALLLPFL